MSEFDEKTSDFLSRLGIFHNHPAGKKLAKDFSTFQALKKAQPSLDDLLKLGFSNFEANLIRKKIQPKVQPISEEKSQEKNQNADPSVKKSPSKVETKSEVNPQKNETKVETKSQPVEQKTESKSEDKNSSSQKPAVQTKSEEKPQKKVETKPDVKTQTETKSESSPHNESKKPPTVEQKPETDSPQVESKQHGKVENAVTETAVKVEPKPTGNGVTVHKVEENSVKNVQLTEKAVTNTLPKVDPKPEGNVSVTKVEEKPSVHKVEEKPSVHKVEEKPVNKNVQLEEKLDTNTLPKVEPKSATTVAATKVEEKPNVHKVEEKPSVLKVEEKPSVLKVEEKTVNKNFQPEQKPVPNTVDQKPVKVVFNEEEKRTENSSQNLPEKNSEPVDEKSSSPIIEESQPATKSKEGPLQIKVIQEPQTKIIEKSDRWIILSALPGSKSDKIEVLLTDDILTIRAPLLTTETTRRLSLYEKKIRIPQYILNHPKLNDNPLETTVQYDRGLLMIEIKKPEFIKIEQPKIQNPKPTTLSATPLSEKNRTSSKSVFVPIKNSQMDMKKSTTTEKGNEDISSAAKIPNPKINPNSTKSKEDPVRLSKPYPRSRRVLDDFAKEIDSFFNDDFFATRRMFGVPPVVSTFPWFDTDPLHPPVFTRPFFRSNVPFSFF